MVEHADKLIYASLIVGKFPKFEIGPQVGFYPSAYEDIDASNFDYVQFNKASLAYNSLGLQLQ